jgi:hypothetical protein
VTRWALSNERPLLVRQVTAKNRYARALANRAGTMRRPRTGKVLRGAFRCMLLFYPVLNVILRLGEAGFGIVCAHCSYYSFDPEKLSGTTRNCSG